MIRTGTVAGGRRASFKVNDLLGAGYQAALALESDQPIVAERPMYFNYSGMGGHSWTGGHVIAGVNYLRRAYYFAEGTTRSNFEEWLTLQNPNASDITVAAEYQMSDTTTATATYEVAANKRLTVYVPGAVGLDKDVSVKLTSTADFLAERPMYFNYSGWGANWTGGHCVIGASAPGDRWFFGEGATIGGFHQFLCIQNPGATDASVSISYYPQGAAPIYGAPFTVPAHSRQTVFVNGDAGSDLQLSTEVKLESGSEIVVERPMYFDYKGWTGGHDVVGGYIYTGRLKKEGREAQPPALFHWYTLGSDPMCTRSCMAEPLGGDALQDHLEESLDARGELARVARAVIGLDIEYRYAGLFQCGADAASLDGVRVAELERVVNDAVRLRLPRHPDDVLEAVGVGGEDGAIDREVARRDGVEESRQAARALVREVAIITRPRA